MIKKEIGDNKSLKNSVVVAFLKEDEDNIHFAMVAESVKPKLGWRLITKKQRNEWNDVLSRVAKTRLKQELSNIFAKRKNKGLSTHELLREFEKKYEQLSSTEQRSTKRLEWVELFVQAVDARLQKSLVQLFEDAIGDLGLTSDWKLVPEAFNTIVKRQMRVDKLIVADSSETSDVESKDKPTSSKHKLEEPVLDDLVKGI
ncbi:hypothetical protein L7F22_032328 [Adiantum nelumboides]|nr:hypothetical protein [Adiantum nelumboides]